MLENPSQSYRASSAIWDHLLLPETRKCTLPQPQPGRPVLDLPTPEGWKPELTGGWLYTKMVYLTTDIN